MAKKNATPFFQDDSKFKRPKDHEACYANQPSQIFSSRKTVILFKIKVKEH